MSNHTDMHMDAGLAELQELIAGIEQDCPLLELTAAGMFDDAEKHARVAVARAFITWQRIRTLQAAVLAAEQAN